MHCLHLNCGKPIPLFGNEPHCGTDIGKEEGGKTRRDPMAHVRIGKQWAFARSRRRVDRLFFVRVPDSGQLLRWFDASARTLCSRLMLICGCKSYANRFQWMPILVLQVVEWSQAAWMTSKAIGGWIGAVLKRTEVSWDKSVHPKIGKGLRRSWNGKPRYRALRPKANPANALKSWRREIPTRMACSSEHCWVGSVEGVGAGNLIL